MAYIRDKNGAEIYISQYHTFGRFRYSVDTVLEGAEISRYHAVIEWINESWNIKDLSTNGTWVNSTKLNRNEYSPLNTGDHIQFGLKSNSPFLFAEASAPYDTLYPLDAQNDEPCFDKGVELRSYNIFPNEALPEPRARCAAVSARPAN